MKHSEKTSLRKGLDDIINYIETNENNKNQLYEMIDGFSDDIYNIEERLKMLERLHHA